MKKLLLGVLAGTLMGMSARANQIAFDTFGPGNTYLGDTGRVVGYSIPPPNTPPTDVGAQFVAGASGNLFSVDLGLNLLPQRDVLVGGPVNVFLYDNVMGQLQFVPDESNQIFLGSVTPLNEASPANNNSVTHLDVTSTIPITLGTTYWLVLKIANAGTSDTWNESLSSVGRVSQNTEGFPWSDNTSNVTQLPAFRVTVADASNPVSDPGGTALLLGIVVAGLVTFHQIRHCRIAGGPGIRAKIW